MKNFWSNLFKKNEIKTEENLNIPPQEWLDKYVANVGKLQTSILLEEYFAKKAINGHKLFKIDAGMVKIPTGRILACDPLVFLGKNFPPYFIKVPTGEFSLTIAVVEIEEDHFRYAAFRVKFLETFANYYVQAMRGDEDFDSLKEPDEYFGFSVDAGLATLVDTATRDAYCQFEERWKKENPDGNIYDDFFAAEFAKNAKENPDFQRSGGDWINFLIPGTDLHIPMIQSGWGDGVYPCYFGYDKDGNICEAVAYFIDIEALGEEEDIEEVEVEADTETIKELFQKRIKDGIEKFPELQQYKMTKESLLKITQSEYVFEGTQGLRFDLNKFRVVINKAYIDPDDGDPMPESILFFNNKTEGPDYFFSLTDDNPSLIFRKKRDEKFREFQEDESSSLYKEAERLWVSLCKYMEKWESKPLTITPTFTYESMKEILHSELVLDNAAGWSFWMFDLPIEEGKITVQKNPQTGKSNFRFEQNKGLSFHFSLNENLSVVYHQKGSEEVHNLTNKSPKRFIYNFNEIWKALLQEFEYKKDNGLTWKKYAAQFKGYPIPEALKKLFDFNWELGNAPFAEEFDFRIYERSDLSTWSKGTDFEKHFIAFACGNGSSSFYGFWLIDNDLNKCPIVVFGDEGGIHIIANNFLEFLQLLTLDVEITVDWEQAWYYKDENDEDFMENYEPSVCHDEYVIWLKENFHLEAIEYADDIIEKAQKEWGDKFEKLLAEYGLGNG